MSDFRQLCRWSGVILDTCMKISDRRYRAVQSKDPRFDGWFVTAVLTTKIYCRPSRPARSPFARNVRFYPTAAAAQRAGFRACKRCRPDASTGSPEWNTRGDVVARAMRRSPTVRSIGSVAPGWRPGSATPPASSSVSCRPSRRRPACAGSRATCTDRPDIDRNHRAPIRRCRIRRWACQHPPAQRHRARVFETTPTALRRRAAGRRIGASHAATGAWSLRFAAANAVRVRGCVRSPSSHRGTRLRGGT